MAARSRKIWKKNLLTFVRFFRKVTPYGEIFKILLQKEFTASPIRVLCSNFVKFGRSEIGKVVRYLPDKKKQNFATLSRSRYCADCIRTQRLPRASLTQCAQSAPNFIRIGSLPVEL